MSRLGQRIVLCVMLGLTSLSSLARDDDAFGGAQPPPPPEPYAMEVEVPRGGPVWITLSAFSLTSPIIRFRIRRQPEGGRLGIPHLVTASTAKVKYQPPPGTGPGTDSFSFQVQSEAGVSVAADVRINLTDKPPVLVTPTEIDFGEVLPGESARRSLVLENIGGGLAQGAVQAPDGWTVEGDTSYHVAGGATQSITLVFTPQEERGYTGDVTYTGDPERATDVKGTELAPVAVTAGPVELTGTGTVRAGIIHAENRTAAVETLRIAPGPDLDVTASVDVPAKGGADIAVRTKPGEQEEVAGQVTITGKGVNATVPVHAAPAPAMTQSRVAAGAAASPAHGERPAAGSVPAPGPEVPQEEEEAFAPAGLPPLGTGVAAQETPDPGRPTTPVTVVREGEDGALVTSNLISPVPPRSYRLEEQSIGLDAQGKLVVKWVPYADAAVEAKGSSISARMSHLAPNSLYVVRLAGLDEQGRVVAVSGMGQVWTARAKRGGHWAWVGLTAIVLAGALGGAWLRRKNRGG